MQRQWFYCACSSPPKELHWWLFASSLWKARLGDGYMQVDMVISSILLEAIYHRKSARCFMFAPQYNPDKTDKIGSGVIEAPHLEKANTQEEMGRGGIARGSCAFVYLQILL